MAAEETSGRQRLSEETREVALSALLEGHPDAWVAAIRISGHFTAMPSEVPLRGQRVIQGPASALELVVAEDRPIVVETWATALQEGGANAVVRPYSNPDRRIAMHFLDLTHRYGVFLGVFLGFSTDSTPSAAAGPLVPRTSVIRKDQVAVITEVDEAATAILGWRADELVGHRSLEFVHPDDQDRAVANWMEMVARPGSSQRVRLRHQHKDGSWVWLEITNHNHLDEPDQGYVLADMVDVTEEVTAIDALRNNERLLRRLTDALPVGVLYVAADGRVTYGNERLAAIIGISWASTVDEQFATAVPADRERLSAAIRAVLRHGRDLDLTATFEPKADSRVHCELSLRALTNESGDVVGAIICVTDTTEDIKLREELRDRARYDLLTGCLNHASVMTELEGRLPALAVDERLVVLFIDLDDFKGVNDRYGHAAGDQVLRHVADRLHEVARGDDLVGRLGGDEFLVVMRTPDDRREVDRIVGRVAVALDKAVRWENGWIQPGASIGLTSVHGGTRTSADALVSVADAAMYESKRQGGRPVVLDASPAGSSNIER